MGAGILQRKATNLVLFLVNYEQARALYSKADLKDSFADYDSDLYPCSKDLTSESGETLLQLTSDRDD